MSKLHVPRHLTAWALAALLGAAGSAAAQSEPAAPKEPATKAPEAEPAPDAPAADAPGADAAPEPPQTDTSQGGDDAPEPEGGPSQTEKAETEEPAKGQSQAQAAPEEAATTAAPATKAEPARASGETAAGAGAASAGATAATGRSNDGTATSADSAAPAGSDVATEQAPATAESAAPPRTHREALTPLRFGVGVGVQLGWRHDRGYERFDDDQNDAQFHGVVAFDALRLPAGAVLGLELDVEQGRQQGSDGIGSGEAELVSQSYMAALVPRLEVLPWLWSHLRVGVGALRSKLRLDPPAGGTFQDDDWGWAVDLAAGVSFPLPRELGRRQLRVQPLLRLEAGYRFAPDAEFSSAGDGDGGIPVQRADLGRLARGAALLRITLGARF